MNEETLEELMRYINTDVSNGVATLTLNDPDKRNAINLQMNDEICEVLDELETSEEVGCLVVTGAGKAFCAGADLGDLLAARERDNIQDIYRGFLRIADSTLPTIAAVNGAAVGAGMNMALACDMILAGESARFDSRFLEIEFTREGVTHGASYQEQTSKRCAQGCYLDKYCPAKKLVGAGLFGKCSRMKY